MKPFQNIDGLLTQQSQEDGIGCGMGCIKPEAIKLRYDEGPRCQGIDEGCPEPGIDDEAKEVTPEDAESCQPFSVGIKPF